MQPLSWRSRPLPRTGRILPLLLCLALGIALTVGRATADSFVLIVNANNPISALSGQEASDLFFKKATNWSDGTKASPVDLNETASARESFSKRIHGKSTSAVKSYWQKMIFSGREIPPPEKASPDEVVAYVKAHRGGIGYVPSGTALGDGVKVLNLR